MHIERIVPAGERATGKEPLRVKVVADALGVDSTTVYREIKSGRLPAYRVGSGRGTFRISRSSFEAYVTERGIPADELLVAAVNNNAESLERLLGSTVEVSSGCLLFTGSLNDKGYGYVTTHGEDGAKRKLAAHRAVYELAIGAIPEGMHVDHLCHNQDQSCTGVECEHRRCINPAHLQAATPRTNIRRSVNTIATKNAAKTHCVNGHLFDEDNTMKTPAGNRACRTCQRARQKAYKARVAAGGGEA